MASKEQIITTGDSCIAEEELPVKANLKVLRINDPDYLLTEGEIEDRNEFIRCYILQQLGVLLTIPKPDNDREFFMTREDWNESAFNTIDFYRMHKPRFSRQGYRVKEILEHAMHLAIIYSVVQSKKDRKRILNQFKALLNKHFRCKIRDLVHLYRKTTNSEKQKLVMDKIDENQRCVMECLKIWEQYAPRGDLSH